MPRTSLAVSVTAVLKVSVNISMFISESRMESAAKFPPIYAWKLSATSGSNLILVMHCFFALFRCNFKVSMTSSWSLPMSAPGKLRVLANVHACFESFLHHDVVNLVVCFLRLGCAR